MWIKRSVRILPYLWALTSACGSDPTDGDDTSGTGTLELTVSTTGHHLDPNGYTVVIDEGAPTPVPANGTVTHDEMEPGAHVLSLADLDENCALQEHVPFPFTIAAGLQTKITLHVTCTFANTLAFTQGGRLYLTSADSGAVPRQIGEGYSYVSWSPDGSTLALVEPWTVSLADADGRNVRVLYRLQGYEGFQFTSGPTWSPDGTSLLVSFGTVHTRWLVALSTIHPTESLGQWDLEYSPQCRPVQAMRAPVPSWSPDGRHIVVNGWSDTVDVYEVPMICMFSAAGKLERVLVRGDYPAWSPDGSRIAFEAARISDSSIHTIAPDGTAERDLSSSSSAGPRERWPTWSPDGEELSFFVHTPDEPDIYIQELWVMDALGGNRRRLVPQVGELRVAWSRDGTRLAFRLSSGQLAVIKRDGTGLTPVSPTGDDVSSWDWRP